MKKFFLYALPLAAVFGAFYWLNGWLNAHALAVFDGENWGFVSRGWRLFLDGWPVFAVFGLMAAVFVGLLTLYFGEGAVETAKATAEAEAEKKYAYRLKRAEERAAEAEALKEKAEERAEAEAEAAYHERMSRIEKKERALKDAIAQAEAEAEESRKFRASARRQVEKSASCAIEQEKAKQAATAYSKRLKNSVLKAIEAAYDGDSEKLSRLYAKLKAETEREAENPHEKAENSCLESAKRFFA